MLLPRPQINDSASNFTDYLQPMDCFRAEESKHGNFTILTVFVKNLSRGRFNTQLGALSEDLKKGFEAAAE